MRRMLLLLGLRMLEGDMGRDDSVCVCVCVTEREKRERRGREERERETDREGREEGGEGDDHNIGLKITRYFYNTRPIEQLFLFKKESYNLVIYHHQPLAPG